VLDENLRLAFPEKSDAERQVLGRRMWEHLIVLIAEMAQASRKLHDTNWRDYVTIENGRPLCESLLSDRPTLLVTGHFGNFEVGGLILGILGFKTHAVARTLDNPFLAAWLDRNRAVTGQHLVPKKGGYEQILRVLGTGGTMVFLADQYAGSKGCWVEFFGHPASAHKAIALFALEHDAPLIVCSSRRTGRPLHIEMRVQGVYDPRTADRELHDVKSVTQWYTTELERMIRQQPEQYWWVHRRWKDNRRKKAVSRRQ
jgi:KDO2-lipid IV(A) lauroyltransferase